MVWHTFYVSKWVSTYMPFYPKDFLNSSLLHCMDQQYRKVPEELRNPREANLTATKKKNHLPTISFSRRCTIKQAHSASSAQNTFSLYFPTEMPLPLKFWGLRVLAGTHKHTTYTLVPLLFCGGGKTLIPQSLQWCAVMLRKHYCYWWQQQAMSLRITFPYAAIARLWSCPIRLVVSLFWAPKWSLVWGFSSYNVEF